MSIIDDDPFVAPATGGTLKTLKDRLLLVFPFEIGKSKSKFPPKDGNAAGLVDHVWCRIVVLDGADGAYEIHRMKILSASMFGQIAPYVGTDRPVLGRLGKAAFDLGEGWVLETDQLTEEHYDTARTWMAAHPVEKKVDPFAKAAKPTS
jgi:hypothetical protein